MCDHPQAQREAEIQPDRMGDDLRRITVVLVTDNRRAHFSPIIRQPLSCRQRDNAARIHRSGRSVPSLCSADRAGVPPARPVP
jgi:hypothetical protein